MYYSLAISQDFSLLLMQKHTNKENMSPALDGLGVYLSKPTLMKKGQLKNTLDVEENRISKNVAQYGVVREGFPKGTITEHSSAQSQ